MCVYTVPEHTDDTSRTLLVRHEKTLLIGCSADDKRKKMRGLEDCCVAEVSRTQHNRVHAILKAYCYTERKRLHQTEYTLTWFPLGLFIIDNFDLF